MSTLLSLYHRLPYPLRVAAASARGYQLRCWRYGPDLEEQVQAALERETWPEERWRAWQEDRLARILRRAAEDVPYYREMWARRRRAGDRAPVEELANWPLLTKEALRQNPRAFLAEGADPRRMLEEHTSGSSGKPLTLWTSRETSRAWYALFEARVRRWNGVSLKDPWGIFGGQLVAPVGQARPPYWVWNRGLKQLYLSSYHISPAAVADYLRALREHGIVYLLGYASSMSSLAGLALEAGLEAAPLKVAVSNAEPLYESQRQVIERAFSTRAVDTYGMSEQVAAASECEHGRLHLWPEAGWIEVLADDEDRPALPGEVGRLVCTGLLNADMPLIRYEVGDRGRLPAGPEEGGCACGRTLPRIASIEGRLDDVLITPDGRRIGRLDPIFKADLPIREAQIIQERVDLVRMLVVPAEGYSPGAGRELEERLRQRVGEGMAIRIEEVESIPRGANGKFRAVVSRLSQKQV